MARAVPIPYNLAYLVKPAGGFREKLTGELSVFAFEENPIPLTVSNGLKYSIPTSKGRNHDHTVRPSRDPVDIRRRFETARGQGNAVPGYTGTEELRSGEHPGDLGTAQPGVDQGKPGEADRRTGTDLGDVGPFAPCGPKLTFSSFSDIFKSSGPTKRSGRVRDAFHSGSSTWRRRPKRTGGTLLGVLRGTLKG